MRMVLCMVQLLRSILVVVRGAPPADVASKRDAFIDAFFPRPAASRKRKGNGKRKDNKLTCYPLLRLRYDQFYNADPFSKECKHYCWDCNGFGCVNFEDTVQRMARVTVQTMLLRRPKKPEPKEWTALSPLGMFI